MKKDSDDLPVIEGSATGLGVRGPEDGNPDVDIDAEGDIILNGRGMSVAPNWRDLPYFRIPIRLVEVFRSARGSNNLYCFVFGGGVFHDGEIASELDLLVTSPTHGVVVPQKQVPLEDFQGLLAQTRDRWAIDEN